jgi:hypothetical protein
MNIIDIIITAYGHADFVFFVLRSKREKGLESELKHPNLPICKNTTYLRMLNEMFLKCKYLTQNNPIQGQQILFF